VTNALALSVAYPPAFTSAAADTVTAGSAFSDVVAAAGVPTPSISLAASSTLPSGVDLVDNGNGTATLTGGATVAAGSYGFVIDAANTEGTTTQAFTLAVDQAPSFTSPAADTVTAGQAFSVDVTTDGYPVASLAEAGTLPVGVHFTDRGDGTGMLSGTALVGAPAVFPVTLTATSGILPPVNEEFTLTVEMPTTAGTTSSPATTTASPAMATTSTEAATTSSATGLSVTTTTSGRQTSRVCTPETRRIAIHKVVMRRRKKVAVVTYHRVVVKRRVRVRHIKVLHGRRIVVTTVKLVPVERCRTVPVAVART